MKKEFIGDRRVFIRNAAIIGCFAALFGTGRPAIREPKRPLPTPEPSGQGYRVTEQVKKYYETARI